MGRLSNPPETLECVWLTREDVVLPPLRQTTSKAEKCSSNPPEAGDMEEKGQLSNPVQRRLSQGDVDELAHLYQEASIDALIRRYGVHRTTIIAHLDRRGVPRRLVGRKMTDPLVTQASERYSEGLSLADVASEFGVHARTLAREFRRAGTPIRGRRGWSR
jgi:AraC-like DNA-binding protein